jgi:hypothetical protein
MSHSRESSVEGKNCGYAIIYSIDCPEVIKFLIGKKDLLLRDATLGNRGALQHENSLELNS